MKMVRYILLITLVTTLILAAFTVSSAEAQPGMTQQPPGGMNSQTTLKIVSLNFSDDNPMEDDEVIIYVEIINNGYVPVANITVSILLDNVIIKNITDISIAANGSKIIEYIWTSEAGYHNIAVVLNVGGMPLQDTKVNENIIVDKEPIGDVPTLILAIISIFIFILIVVIVPSILSAFQPAKVRSRINILNNRKSK